MSTNAQLSAHPTSRETRRRKGAKETGDQIQIAPHNAPQSFAA